MAPLFAASSDRSWWLYRQFKWLRVAGLFYIMENMSKAPPNARKWHETLTLGVNMIYMLNGLIYRPAEGQRETELAEVCTLHVLDDEEDEPVPIGDRQGLYLLSAVREDYGVYRMPVGVTLAGPTLARSYGMDSVEDLEYAFTPALRPPPRRRAHHTRIQNRSTTTQSVAVLRDADEVPAAQPFQLEEQGLIFLRGAQMAGSDAEDAGPDEDGPTGLNQRVADMWAQFAMDIFSKAPNKRRVADRSYLIMDFEERRLVTAEVFERKVLPFTSVFLRHADETMWENAFTNYFPPKGHQRAAASQNFGSVRYMKMWSTLRDGMTKEGTEVVRRGLRSRFNKFKWIPYASDRIWATTVQRGPSWTQLPDGTGTPAPNLYLNPRNRRVVFSLAEIIEEEGSEED